MANNGVTFALGLAQKQVTGIRRLCCKICSENGKAKLLLVAADAAEILKRYVFYGRDV